MRTADYLMLLAVLLGPILAVQAQAYLERRRERRNGKLQVFYSLMATRADRISTEHVRALNRIDLEFYKHKSVRDGWAIYRDHLFSQFDDASFPTWISKGDDLFVDLLHVISKELGFDFDKVNLRKGSYSPKALGEADRTERDIKTNLSAVLAGTRPITIRVQQESK